MENLIDFLGLRDSSLKGRFLSGAKASLIGGALFWFRKKILGVFESLVGKIIAKNLAFFGLGSLTGFLAAILSGSGSRKKSEAVSEPSPASQQRKTHT